MRISEAAKSSGLGVETIRYYERTGLLPPIRRDPGDRRCFSPEDVEWLALLASLRETGMPMKTMRLFADLYRGGNATIPDRRKVLQRHFDELERRRSALNRCAALLTHKLDRYDQLARNTPCASS